MSSIDQAPRISSKNCAIRDATAGQRWPTSLPRPWVFTNGVFDVLHRGHVMYLAQARALGGSLIVALNTDASVQALGQGR